MPLGISLDQIDKDSFLGLAREELVFPIAALANYFTSATAGGVQGNFVISAAVVGTDVFRSTQAAKPLYYARRPSLTITDASGVTLTCTVRVVGRRFGELVTQDIVAGTAVSATPVTSNGSRVIDEIISVTILAISNQAASDTLSIGVDDSWLGLMRPIRSFRDVKMVYKIAAATPSAAGPLQVTDMTSVLVNVRDSALDVKALHAAVAIAVTDRYLVEYIAAGSGRGFARRKGFRFA